jgi:predicted nicotinamide N-methyase
MRLFTAAQSGPVRLPPFSVEIEQHWQQQCADCEPVHAVVWDAGVALCDWLCEAGREAVAPGSSIIELGSGTGLVSIVAARLGAQRVVATDLEPALLLLGRNVWQQGSADRCAVRRCMWGDKADIHQIREEQRRTIPGSDEKFDVVLGSDLTYKETNDAAAALLGTICEFLAPGATAYVSFKFRANPDDVTFVHLAQVYGGCNASVSQRCIPHLQLTC